MRPARNHDRGRSRAPTRASELDVAVEITAVHAGERFHERRVPGSARVVAGVRLQLGCSMRVRASGPRRVRRTRKPAPVYRRGRRVHVGSRCRLEQLLGPGKRLEQLDGEADQRGVRGDVGGHRDLAVPCAPLISLAQIAQLHLYPVDRVTPAGTVPTLPAVGRLLREVPGMPVTRTIRDRLLGPAGPRRTAGWSRTAL